jgi:hypothetical protein
MGPSDRYRLGCSLPDLDANYLAEKARGDTE